MITSSGRVTLVVNNPVDGLVASESNVSASTAIPAGATLVANSVTATQGTVVSGNSASDSSVVVSIGTIADGGSATITFDLVLQAPTVLPPPAESVQAVLTSQTLTQLTSNDATTQSGPTDITPIFLSPANLSATQTVSGNETPSNTATYTIVISNSSASAQFDNPGDEFTETFPAGVTVIGITATSGLAATLGGNGVSWMARSRAMVRSRCPSLP